MADINENLDDMLDFSERVNDIIPKMEQACEDLKLSLETAYATGIFSDDDARYFLDTLAGWADDVQSTLYEATSMGQKVNERVFILRNEKGHLSNI